MAADVQSNLLDYSLHCCNKCKGLFSMPEEKMRHQLTCTANPFKSPCTHFACERKIFLQLFQPEDFEVEGSFHPLNMSKDDSFINHFVKIRMPDAFDPSIFFRTATPIPPNSTDLPDPNFLLDENIKTLDTEPVKDPSDSFLDNSKPMESIDQQQIQTIINKNIEYLRNDDLGGVTTNGNKPAQFQSSQSEPRLLSPIDKHLNFMGELSKSRGQSPFEKCAGYLNDHQFGFQSSGFSYSSNLSVPYSCNLSTDLLSSFTGTSDENQQALLTNIEECRTLQYLDLAKKDPFFGQNPGLSQINTKDPFLTNAAVKSDRSGQALCNQRLHLTKSCEDIQSQASPSFQLQEANYFNFPSTLDEPTQLDYLDLATIDFLTNPNFTYSTNIFKDKICKDDDIYSENNLVYLEQSNEHSSEVVPNLDNQANSRQTLEEPVRFGKRKVKSMRLKKSKSDLGNPNKPYMVAVSQAYESGCLSTTQTSLVKDSVTKRPSRKRKMSETRFDRYRIMPKETFGYAGKRLCKSNKIFNVSDQLVGFTEEQKGSMKAIFGRGDCIFVKKQIGINKKPVVVVEDIPASIVKNLYGCDDESAFSSSFGSFLKTHRGSVVDVKGDCGNEKKLTSVLKLKCGECNYSCQNVTELKEHSLVHKTETDAATKTISENYDALDFERDKNKNDVVSSNSENVETYSDKIHTPESGTSKLQQQIEVSPSTDFLKHVNVEGDQHTMKNDQSATELGTFGEQSDINRTQSDGIYTAYKLPEPENVIQGSIPIYCTKIAKASDDTLLDGEKSSSLLDHLDLASSNVQASATQAFNRRFSFELPKEIHVNSAAEFQNDATNLNEFKESERAPDQIPDPVNAVESSPLSLMVETVLEGAHDNNSASEVFDKENEPEVIEITIFDEAPQEKVHNYETETSGYDVLDCLKSANEECEIAGAFTQIKAKDRDESFYSLETVEESLTTFNIPKLRHNSSCTEELSDAAFVSPEITKTKSTKESEEYHVNTEVNLTLIDMTEHKNMKEVSQTTVSQDHNYQHLEFQSCGNVVEVDIFDDEVTEINEFSELETKVATEKEETNVKTTAEAHSDKQVNEVTELDEYENNVLDVRELELKCETGLQDRTDDQNMIHTAHVSVLHENTLRSVKAKSNEVRVGKVICLGVKRRDADTSEKSVRTDKAAQKLMSMANTDLGSVAKTAVKFDQGFSLSQDEGPDKTDTSLTPETSESKYNLDKAPFDGNDRKDPSLFHCEECDYTASRKYQLNTHRLKHSGVLHRCSVPGCQFKSAYQKNLLQHERVKHTGENKFPCHMCSYVTDQKKTLVRHIQSNHLKQKRFKCTDCDYASMFRTDVVQHYRNTHLHQKLFSCNQCEYKTSYTHRLRLHLMAHAGIRPYKCSACDYQVNDANKVTRHMRTKHAGQTGVTCEKLDLEFEIDAKQFQCEAKISEKEIKVIELKSPFTLEINIKQVNQQSNVNLGNSNKTNNRKVSVTTE